MVTIWSAYTISVMQIFYIYQLKMNEGFHVTFLYLCLNGKESDKWWIDHIQKTASE